ncbi:MAG: tail fiber domain-containing protein [bacterium]|nr:tail fiber domain-containing protein [bacterium]
MKVGFLLAVFFIAFLFINPLLAPNSHATFSASVQSIIDGALEITIPQFPDLASASVFSSIGDGIKSFWNSVGEFVYSFFETPIVIVQAPVFKVPSPTPSESGKTSVVPGTPDVEEDESPPPPTKTVYVIQAQSPVTSNISESNIITKVLGIVNQNIIDRFNILSASLLQKISSPIVYYSSPASSSNSNLPSQLAYGDFTGGMSTAGNLSVLGDASFGGSGKTVTVNGALSVNGVTGLTDADIPNGITASNYLLLTGGTLSGALNGTDLTLSGTLTAGSLAVAGVSSGGAVEAPYFTATSTTATSTFASLIYVGTTTVNNTPSRAVGGLTTAVVGDYEGVRIIGNDFPNSSLSFAQLDNSEIAGIYITPDIPSAGHRLVITASNSSNILNLQENGGKVGVGSTTPWARLSVNGSGTGTGKAFAIGDSSNNSRFVVQDNGNVGIGTTSPLTMLDVNAGSSAVSASFRSTNTQHTVAIDNLGGTSFKNQVSFRTLGTEKWAIGNDANANGSDTFYIWNATGGRIPFFIDGTANNIVLSDSGSYNVGIGTTSPWKKLSVTGTVGFDGLTGAVGAGSLCLSANNEVVYNSASDNCLSSTRATKHDITKLSFQASSTQDALTIVGQLQPVSFVYNEGDGRTRYGFIAEDVALIDSHLATYDASSTISGIDDRSILSVVVKAIQELWAYITSRFDSQDARIQKLEDRIRELEEERGSSSATLGTTPVEDIQTPDVVEEEPEETPVVEPAESPLDNQAGEEAPEIIKEEPAPQPSPEASAGEVEPEPHLVDESGPSDTLPVNEESF